MKTTIMGHIRVYIHGSGLSGLWCNVGVYNSHRFVKVCKTFDSTVSKQRVGDAAHAEHNRKSRAAKNQPWRNGSFPKFGWPQYRPQYTIVLILENPIEVILGKSHLLPPLDPPTPLGPLAKPLI